MKGAKSVFIVDNRQSERKLMGSYFEERGFDVFAAVNAKVAYREMIGMKNGENLPDILIAGPHIVGMSHMELLESLYTAGIDIPTIVITGDPKRSMKAEVLRLGRSASIRESGGFEMLAKGLCTVLQQTSGAAR